MEKPRFYITEQEKLLGEQIVLEEMGEQFRLNFDLYPHNKGVKGDEGVYGETIEIEMLDSSFREKLKFQVENMELIALVAGRLTNELASVTKVLFNIATDIDKDE